MRQRVAKLLIPYYEELKALTDKKNFKQAEKYLNSLNPGLYDLIVESAISGTSFAGILGAIDKSKKRDRGEDYYHKGLPKDDNSIF